MLEDLKPHLIELRKRLVISICALLAAFALCFSFWEIILSWIIAPLEAVLPEGTKPVFIEVGEAFFTALKVSFFASFIISLPIIFWQLWAFIAPGLYANEKRFVLPFISFGTIMFVLGALFAYYVVFPFGLNYLINFGGNIFTALPSVGFYATFFAKIMVGFGLSFELPVITFFLAKVGLVTDVMLIKFFRVAVVLIFVLAAILTPPDVLSQFMMAMPLIFLYGVSIIIARVINPEIDTIKQQNKVKSKTKDKINNNQDNNNINNNKV